LVRRRVTNCYHGLACAGRRFLVGLVAFNNPYHASDLGPTLPRETFTKHYHRIEGLGMTEYYVGLELVVGGAVDEGDVVLSFIGQHTGTGCEVLGRPAWHFDRVCDLTGRLATGHQVLAGLFRHLWHIQLLCSML
jgi:hypothetical protein